MTDRLTWAEVVERHKANEVLTGLRLEYDEAELSARVFGDVAASDLKPVEMPPLATVANVEIVAAGTWQLSTGEATFTPEDLAAAVEAADCPAVGSPRLKLGHVDPRFDGQPAVGRVANMALMAEGNKIVGDLAGMPGWLGEVIGSAYPNRSIEAAWGVRCSIGHVHPFVITALALLGVTGPGVGVLGDLGDVAALYGVNAGGEMTTPVQAAAVTVEDVRRAYYAGAGANAFTYWITEIQMDPPQLIVCDEASDTTYRVPFKIKGGEVTFSDPVAVEVEYVDTPQKTAASAWMVRYGSAAASRAEVVEAAWSGSTQVKNMGDNPSQADLNKMFALPGDTKSDSKLPHHTASGGTVDGPDEQGVHAAISAINGGRGGLKGVSEPDARAAFNHLTGHLKNDFGVATSDLPEYGGPGASTAAAGDTDDAGAASSSTHGHGHVQNDRKSARAAGTTAKRGNTVQIELTDEDLTALRASLGLAEDAELTTEQLIAGVAELRKGADTKVAAGRGALPPTAMIVDKQSWEDLQARVAAGEAFRTRTLHNERDEVIQAAVRAGKFSKVRIPQWQRAWDNDPDGTREILGSLPKNVIPVMDIGQAGGDPDEEIDREFAALYPPDEYAGRNNRRQ